VSSKSKYRLTRSLPRPAAGDRSPLIIVQKFSEFFYRIFEGKQHGLQTRADNRLFGVKRGFFLNAVNAGFPI